MKNKIIRIWIVLTITLICTDEGCKAASFSNPNFEFAHVPIIPDGQFGTNEPIAKALPGWSAFIGVHPTTTILHNSITLGDPSIALFGPNNYSSFVINGQYSVFLIAGSNENAPPDDVGASISQTAVVPNGSLSILFKTRSASSTFGLFANGNSLSLVPVFATNLYTLYGADITPYAGQNTELKFTSFFNPGTFNGTLLDDISFSTNPIPEPSSLALLALAGVGLAWRVFPKAKAHESSRDETDETP